MPRPHGCLWPRLCFRLPGRGCRVGVAPLHHTSGCASLQAHAHPKLQKQLEYLGKLVRATVHAMKGS